MKRALAARAQGKRRAIEGNLVCGFNVRAKMRFNLLLRDWGREQDATSGRCSRQLADHDIGRTRQRRGLLHHGASSVGEYEAAVATVARKTIGIGKCKQHATAYLTLARSTGGGDLRRPASRQLARALRPLGAVAVKLIEPAVEIDTVAAEPAFGEHGRDLGSLPARVKVLR